MLRLLLFFSQHSNPLGLRLDVLKEPCVPARSIVMKYIPQEIAQVLSSQPLDMVNVLYRPRIVVFPGVICPVLSVLVGANPT